jgi:DNA repair protein RecO (recombination protein O)
MEWEGPAVVLRVQALGEGDAIASLLTEAGRLRGVVRGGAARARAATWQPGNLVRARRVARLETQLGSITGELVHAAAAAAMADPLALAVLAASCAVADGALPEQEPAAAVFGGLLHVIAHAGQGEAAIVALVEWEVGLLASLGFGLDLARCARSGAETGLAYVSPRTGRAVTAEAAGEWGERLLRLPGFLAGRAEEADWGECADGLALSGFFLGREVFGARNVGVPEARQRLQTMVEKRREGTSFSEEKEAKRL